MSKVHNFSAGPSILHQDVLKKASEAVINFNNLNLSILEISHRSKDFVAVMDNAVALVKLGSKVIGGTGGGGRNDFAQAGGNLPEKIEKSFQNILDNI